MNRLDQDMGVRTKCVICGAEPVAFIARDPEGKHGVWTCNRIPCTDRVIRELAREKHARAIYRLR